MEAKKREMCITRGIVQLIFLMLVCAPNQVVTSNDVDVIIILRPHLHYALKSHFQIVSRYDLT